MAWQFGHRGIKSVIGFTLVGPPREASVELEPHYRRPKFPSKLDDYEKTLTSWLHRKTKRPRKQRRTAMHLHQNLVQILGHNWMQSNKVDFRVLI